MIKMLGEITQIISPSIVYSIRRRILRGELIVGVLISTTIFHRLGEKRNKAKNYNYNRHSSKVLRVNYRAKLIYTAKLFRWCARI